MSFSWNTPGRTYSLLCSFFPVIHRAGGQVIKKHNTVSPQTHLLFSCLFYFYSQIICLTYKSLACLHPLRVMTTRGKAGQGLRKCCVECMRSCAYLLACLLMCVWVKSQIRYQQGSWIVLGAGKLPNQLKYCLTKSQSFFSMDDIKSRVHN